MDWSWIWGAPAAAAGFTFGWQCLAAARFPLHRRLPAPPAPPNLTLLKPLKGADEHTAACLRSWLTQRYAGGVRILFGVRDAADPVTGVVEALLREFPQADARLVICPRDLGPNAKVSTLAHLEPLAVGEVVVVSDADVFAPPDLLEQIAASLADPQVHLVNCLYRLATACTPGMRWEAAAVNADFWSQVLQARTLAPQDFALGAVMAVRRQALAGLGGFASLVDFLADDFQLGQRVARGGGRIELARVVAECWEPATAWGRVWAHQTRWARTLRVCEPGKYFASIIANPTLWWAVWAAGTRPAWAWAALLLAARAAGAGWLAARLARGSNRPSGAFSAVLWSPLKDLLGALVWASAFAGSQVHWRGRDFEVRSDGRLVPVTSA